MRYSVPEAAQQLGISEGAVRTRLSRGTLDSVKEGGKVYVVLNLDTTSTQQDETHDMPPSEPTALISAKDDLIAALREQLAAERRANEENRRLLAAALERIPQLEAPAEATGATETPAEGTQRGTDPENQQASPTRRWWEFWR
jgi:hypothetical protein